MAMLPGLIRKINQSNSSTAVVAAVDPFIYAGLWGRYLLQRVCLKKRPTVINVFYISTSKTGSEWIKRVIADKDVVFHSRMGLYRARWLRKNLTRKILPYTATTSLGISYDEYLVISKPKHYRTLYVHRDPRDILVSWYFSKLYSHSLNEKVRKIRNSLKDMSERNGILHTLGILEQTAFQSMRSWLRCDEEQVLVMSYEEMIANSIGAYIQIFEHFGWSVPSEVVKRVVERYSFKRQSGGRERGQEDVRSHQRKGHCTGQKK